MTCVLGFDIHVAQSRDDVACRVRNAFLEPHVP